MEAVTFSETLVTTYRITLCPAAEDHLVIAYKYEYLRSHHIREVVLLAQLFMELRQVCKISQEICMLIKSLFNINGELYLCLHQYKTEGTDNFF